ncbi:response regulator transcription factor [Faecalibacterium sp. An121]|uniref:response regulator transcription factor n=1 Tax=Faecalibacterium sp. An121 TaxID=1965550 RepID=UPI000B374A89|nr:response regulator transcription factor [Faecalibacterium sp. An121]OUQ40638.1 DNA-binding response regulator [Faecalibacterium sp. An121]
MSAQTILLVEDDPDIRDGVRILLAGEGYHILEAENGARALEVFGPEVDLVILDVMMPGMSGLRVCEELRKSSTVPILFLTAKSQESDKLLGLTAGGDDYLPKPFSFAELSARVKALLRRYCVYQGKAQAGVRVEEQMLCAGGVRLALDYNRVWVDGQAVDLTDTEYKILRLLMQNPRQIFPVQALYEKVWNEPYFYVSNGTVMVHIRNLRVKIEKDPQNPKRVCTVWGKGYHFGGGEGEDV